jgi:hypothetical protein
MKNLPKEAPIDITEQKKAIARKSDGLRGFTITNYEQFCDEIDKIIHENSMDYYDSMPSMPVGFSRPRIKANAKYLHEEFGKSYYEIYLDIKFNP